MLGSSAMGKETIKKHKQKQFEPKQRDGMGLNKFRKETVVSSLEPSDVERRV